MKKKKDQMDDTEVQNESQQNKQKMIFKKIQKYFLPFFRFFSYIRTV